MARPQKETDEKLTEVVLTRLRLREREYIRKQASAGALSGSEFIRRRALSLPVKPPARKADGDLLFELNRIGVNVNQLARATNAEREFRGDWQTLAKELRRVLDKVADAYGS